MCSLFNIFARGLFLKTRTAYLLKQWFRLNSVGIAIKCSSAHHNSMTTEKKCIYSVFNEILNGWFWLSHYDDWWLLNFCVWLEWCLKMSDKLSGNNIVYSSTEARGKCNVSSSFWPQFWPLSPTSSSAGLAQFPILATGQSSHWNLYLAGSSFIQHCQWMFLPWLVSKP